MKRRATRPRTTSRRRNNSRRRKDEHPEVSFEDRINALSLQDWNRAAALLSVYLATEEATPSTRAAILADLVDVVEEGAKDFAKDWLKWWFIDWWHDSLEAALAYDQIDGWIVGPFNPGHDDGDVRSFVATQITALDKTPLVGGHAKEKLVKKLRKRAADLRERAKKERSEGKTAQADRDEMFAHEFDVAAEECEK